MEKDNEHTQGKYETAFRKYDARLGRWSAVDPLVGPHESSYVGMDNNPILMVDPEGLKPRKHENHFKKSRKVKGEKDKTPLAKRIFYAISKIRQAFNGRGYKPLRAPAGRYQRRTVRFRVDQQSNGFGQKTEIVRTLPPGLGVDKVTDVRFELDGPDLDVELPLIEVFKRMFQTMFMGYNPGVLVTATHNGFNNRRMNRALLLPNAPIISGLSNFSRVN